MKENTSSNFDYKLKKITLDFVVESLKICKKNKSTLTTSEEPYPQLKSGKYNKVIEKKITNYDYFVETSISSELEKLEDFVLLNMGLSEQPIKKYYQNFYKQKEQEIPKDIQELTKILPKKLLIHYLNLQKNFEFNEKIFNQAIKDFFSFIKNYTTDEYIMPLYNFQYNTKHESLQFGKITLRKITDYELKTISKLDEKKRISDLNREITHVLSTILLSDNLSSGFDNVKKEFQLLLDALTLNFMGDLQIATIYQNINYHWKPFERGSEVKNFPVKNQLIFVKEKYYSLKNFYYTLKKTNIEQKENLFVQIAISRFRTSLNRSSLVDKIIDFVTSLESLYTSGPGDLSRKLSQRCCMVIGTNDERREFYHDFLKKAYNFRSGLVHGEGKREILIDEKSLDIEEISSLLEKITRESIKKYLKLINHYTGKNKNKQIIQDIDNSIINRKKYSTLKKKF